MLVQESTYARMMASDMQDAEYRVREEIAVSLLDILDNETIAAKTNLSIEKVVRLRQQTK